MEHSCVRITGSVFMRIGCECRDIAAIAVAAYGDLSREGSLGRTPDRCLLDVFGKLHLAKVRIAMLVQRQSHESFRFSRFTASFLAHSRVAKVGVIKLHDTGQLVELLDLKSATAYDLAKRGHFETTLIERKIRIVNDSFESWYANQNRYVKIWKGLTE